MISCKQGETPGDGETAGGTGPSARGARCGRCGHPIRHVGPQRIHWVHVSNGLPACAPPEREEHPDA